VARLFPIQAATFKPLTEGRDLIGRARTGTGKTLAFSLPIIEKLIRVRAAARARRAACRMRACSQGFCAGACRRLLPVRRAASSPRYFGRAFTL
jgi:ATP-dependent helicase YprA (DUF1998 family)